MISSFSTKKWILTSALALAFVMAAVGSRSEVDHFPPISIILSNICHSATREQATERAFKSRYYYLRTRETREFDGKGKVTKETTKINPNTPSNSPALYPEASNRVFVSTSSAARGTAKPNAQGFEKSDLVLNEDLFKRFEFTILKREQFNGRKTLVIDFKPAQKIPIHGLKDKFLSKTAGRVWVDECDWNLARGDFRLIDKVNVVGGLVGSVKSFTYTFDRQRTEDGLWYTYKVHWRLEGRELFSGKVIEYDEKRTDIKRGT